jgi:hypothetical protein
MMEAVADIALIATAVAFVAGFLLTVTTGAVRPVKIFLGVLSGIFILGLVGGLIFTRGLLIYLLFQIIALVLLGYLLVIAGAVCGGGVYMLLHKTPAGKNLDRSGIAAYLPAEEFARIEAVAAERVVSRIKSGYYQGGLLEGAWYIHKSELSQNKNHKETL